MFINPTDNVLRRSERFISGPHRNSRMFFSLKIFGYDFCFHFRIAEIYKRKTIYTYVFIIEPLCLFLWVMSLILSNLSFCVNPNHFLYFRSLSFFLSLPQFTSLSQVLYFRSLSFFLFLPQFTSLSLVTFSISRHFLSFFLFFWSYFL